MFTSTHLGGGVRKRIFHQHNAAPRVHAIPMMITTSNEETTSRVEPMSGPWSSGIAAETS